MALMKKPKDLNINFNFSDDSDDEKDTGSSNIPSKHVLKELKNESNNTEIMVKYLHSTDDKTIISSDHLHTSELPSFSEDFALPVTESTCLDVFDNDATLYLTALSDDLNLSQPHDKTAAENKSCHISHRTTTRKLHTSIRKSKLAEDPHLTRDKENILSQASTVSCKPTTKNHEDDPLWSIIGETPRKGNKTSVKHRLYDNDGVFTPLRVNDTDKKINHVLMFQNESTEDSPYSKCRASDEQSSLLDHSSSDSFVEVQDTSVQTSFAIDDIPESEKNHAHELQNNMPDCEDSFKSDVSLFDSPNQATDDKVCEESIRDSSEDIDRNEDDLLASSYEVQDISVQTSFVESLIPNDNSLAKDLEHSSKAPECMEPSVHKIQKSFMGMNIQNGEGEHCSLQAKLSDDDKEHSGCSSSANINKIESESVSENGKNDTYATARGGKVNKDQTVYPGNAALSGNSFRTYREGLKDCTAQQTHSSVNYSEDQRNTYRCLPLNISYGEDSSEVLAVASDSKDEDGETECTNKIEEDESANREVDKHSDYQTLNRRKWRTVSQECSPTTSDSECEAKPRAGGQLADKTKAKTWAPTEANRGPNRDTATKTSTKAAALVNIGRSRRQVSESSDDDSDFENFLNKVKSSSKPEKSVQEKMPLNEFIIDDDEEDDNDSSKTTDEDDNDDAVFYIKTNNELDDVKNKKQLSARFQEEAYTYYHSDVSSSDVDESDSDLDDFIVDSHPKKKDDKIKSAKAAFDLSSDESLLETKPAAKNKVKTTSKRWGKNTKCSDDKEELDEQKTVSTTLWKGTNFSSRPVTQGSFEDGDCPSREHRNVPFEIPGFEQWKHSFETPARSDAKKVNFKTPRNVKGLDVHPTTAPRPAFGGDGVSDHTFFLKSLNAEMADYKRHADAARFIKRFKETKVELTQKVFKIFNGSVFQDKLPTDFQIEWNSRYTKTAGTFHYKGNKTSFVTKIVLSVKICDSPERVRDTLAHELCHAAVRLINNVNEAHGVFWKSWARKVNITFPFMPVIARCHSYNIATKYTYQCVNCRYRIGRHSKSLDTESKVCGHCHGKFELYLTRELHSKSSGCQTPVTPVTPRTPNKFAMFVKECYSQVKKREEGLRHSDVMKILSHEFAEKNKICD